MATPIEHLNDAVVNYLASLENVDFNALVAQARPPVDPSESRPGYVTNNVEPRRPAPQPGRRITAADAKAEVARRHGRILGEEGK